MDKVVRRHSLNFQTTHSFGITIFHDDTAFQPLLMVLGLLSGLGADIAHPLDKGVEHHLGRG